MASVLFNSLAVVLGGVVFAGVFGTYIYTKLSSLRKSAHPRVDRYVALGMSGAVLTKGIILYAILQQSTVTPSLVAWLYLAGALIQGLGMVGLIRHGIVYLADAEVKNGREEAT